MALPPTIQDRDYNNFKDNGDGTTSRFVHVVNPGGGGGGDASAANQVIGNASLASIDTKLTAPIAVTATSLPLPTGAATEVTLASVLAELGQKTEPTDAQNIRSLDFATDQVDVTGSVVALDATTLAALENINVTVTSIGEVEIKNDVGSPVPVSGTVTANLGTIAGVATETTLSALNTKVPANLTVTSTRLLVDGSGVTQPVSGTVTANAGTNLNTSLLALDATLTNRTQKTQITNGTNDVAVLNVDPSGSSYGAVVRNIPRERLTYAAATPSTVPAATATDIFTITGSASKTVYIHKITVTGTRTAHAHDLVQLIKRSTANTAGTSSTLTNVPYDSTNAAATATVRSYTANPTLGTAVGTLYARRVSFPVQTPSNAQGNGGPSVPWVWEAGINGQAIVLRGVAQVLAVNLNAVTIAGGILQFSIEWSEE